MKLIFCLWIVFNFLLISCPAQINSGGEAVPILVLQEFNVWSEIPGADSPEFVLYEDGTVIFYGLIKEGTRFYGTVKLSPDEVNELLKQIKLERFATYKPFYTISPDHIISDLPSPFLKFRDTDGSYKTIGTYGSMDPDAEPMYRVQGMPQSLVYAFVFLWNYQHPRAEVWKADFVEFIIWEYDGKSKKNVRWDTKYLPGLTDAKTVSYKLDGKQYHSIFIPKALHKKISRIYFKARRTQGALLLDGKRWSFTYRFPFPSERVWLADENGKIFRDGQ